MGPEPGGPWSWRLFEFPFRPWLSRRLAGIHLDGLPASPPDPSLPLLLVANHTSWFDGFLLREVHRRLRPSGVLRTVMLLSELEGRPILRALGGTGFDPDRPQTLRKVLSELKDLRSVAGGLTVSYFPQGRILPAWKEPLDFRGGIRLMQSALSPAMILPIAIHLEMGNRTRPSAFLSAGELMEGGSATELEDAVGAEAARIREHLSRYGEKSAAHWPPARR